MPKTTTEVFAYQWSDAEEQLDDNDYPTTVVRCYGVTGDGKTVYIKITDFTPYCYVELPQYTSERIPKRIQWTPGNIQFVKEKITKLSYKRENQPVHIEFTRKKKLYFAEKTRNSKSPTEEISNNDNDTYADVYYPFLFVSFKNSQSLRTFCWNLKKTLLVSGIGEIRLEPHETENVSPVLRIFAIKKIPAAGWITATGELVPVDERESTFDLEYLCSYQNLEPSINDTIVHPRIVSYDIEANSTVTSAMPDASKPDDKVFQISLVSLIDGVVSKVLLTLGEPDPKRVGDDTTIYRYKTEADLLIGFRDKIYENNYNVIIGFNILGWDFEYMINRSKFTKVFNGSGKCFSKIGCLQDGRLDPEVAPKFESKAYSAQKLVYLESEGRLYIDLLPVIKRDYKLVNYRLKTVTTHFGLPTKDPLTPQDIFRCYREFTPESLGEVGKYCVQDAYITLLLFRKIQMWFGLCEMAKTAHVPIFYLYSKGTQIQMFSQVMEFCMYNDYIIPAEKYLPRTGEEEYAGAIVLEPVPGKYKKVLCFDFASLYPSIMMAYNICYSTFVKDDLYPIGMYDVDYISKLDTKYPKWIKMSLDDADMVYHRVDNIEQLVVTVDGLRAKHPERLILVLNRESQIKDCDCHIFQWEDHINCKHDTHRAKKKNGEYSTAKKKIICGQRYYRFIKSEHGKGVVPVLLESLISRRKQTRRDIARNEGDIRKMLVQLMAVQDDDVEIKSWVERFRADNKKFFEDIEVEVEKEIQAGNEYTEEGLRENMERIVYLNTYNSVLDKRQSSYKICANSMYGAMGVKKGYLPLIPGASTVTHRGRRAIQFISTYIPEHHGGITVYGDTDSAMIYFPHISDNREAVELAERITAEMERFFPKPMKLEFEKIYEKYLILTKKRYMALVANKLGQIIDFTKKGVVLSRRDNCKFLRDIYYQTVMSMLNDEPTDKILSDVVDAVDTLFQRKYSFRDFVVTKSMNRAEYSSKTLPAHVQLANRMRDRGIVVATGSRIEYIFTTNCRGEKNPNQGEKAEDIDYFAQYREYLRVDYLYYMEKQILKPMDELIKIGLGIDKFMTRQYQYRKQREALNTQLVSVFTPKLVLETDEVDKETQTKPQSQNKTTRKQQTSKHRKPRAKKTPPRETEIEITAEWV